MGTFFFLPARSPRATLGRSQKDECPHFRRERRRLSAFSLVEMMAALTVFGVGVLGTMEVFTNCLHSSSASQGYTQAVYLAQQVLEETIAENRVTVGQEQGDFGERSPRHSWQQEITETDQKGLYRLRVTVQWSERGRDKQYALETLVSDRQ
jgi:prepilin-type N-terminal cleavage/methylation domain-containing protein